MSARFALLLLPLVACSSDFQDPPAVWGTLTLDDPTPATWAGEGMYAVSGTATDVSSVTVNGQEMTLAADGTFSGEIELKRGLNTVEAFATETDGDTLFARNGVLAGEFGEPTGTIDEAAYLRLNQGGLDAVLALGAGMLDATTINDAVTGANPVYSGSWVWGTVTARAYVDSISFSTPRLVADPNPGELVVAAELPDVVVQVTVSGSIFGISYSTGADVYADPAAVRVGLSPVVRNGRLDVTLNWSEVELHDFYMDTSLLPGDLDSYIPELQNAVRGALEDAIVEQLETQVPDLVSEQLGSFDMSFATEVMGVPVAASATFASATVDDDGLQAAVNLDLTIPSGADVPYYQGVLLAEPGPPQLDHYADISLAASDDLMNRILFDLWRGGLLNMAMTSQEQPLLSLLFLQLQAPDGGAISTDAMLPPVLIGVDQAIQVQVGELGLNIDSPGGELGERLEISAAAYLDLEMDIVGGALEISPGEVSLDMVVRGGDWRARPETITRLLEEKLPLDMILGLVSIDPIPLDFVDGLVFNSAEVSHEGSYTNIGIDLVTR